MEQNTASETIECVVIGAGVVGLAIARELALSGRTVILLESAGNIGTGISSRNSEVIHAGIYYHKSSLKALLCVHGRELLYQYAITRHIPYNRCGKIIVASNKQQAHKLQFIQNLAKDNGVNDLKLLSQKDTHALEPALKCENILLSPSTGIINSHELMISLLGDFENAGGICSFLTYVKGAEICDDGIIIHTQSQNETMHLKANIVINAAGLNAVNIARNIINFPKAKIPDLRYAKGNYFALNGKAPFKHLIYPVPEDAGLGIHLTFDMAGQCRFGPDVEWIKTLDYKVNSNRSAQFYNAIRTYWPNLEDGMLTPDYAGIRPKIYFNDTPYTDFIIQGKQDHNISGLINLFGIESPGLTASLAIAKYVTKMFAH